MAKPATPAPVVAPAQAKIIETPAVSAEAARMSTFAIEDGVAIPIKRIGVKGVSSYPFASLNIGQSFFVPVTAKTQEPWKTLTSMASRNSREGWPKRFITARVAASGTTPEGVRIWRTTDGTGDVPDVKIRGKRAKKEVASAATVAPPADPFVPQAAA